MRSEDFAAELKRNGLAVFTIEDAAKLLLKPKAYISHYLSRNHHVVRLERGKYALRSVQNINTIASHIVQPSYVSLSSAMRFYNLTTQLPHTVFVVSTRRHRGIKNLLGYDVKFRTVNKRLMFGYRTVHGANMATVEKAMLDSLYFDKNIYAIKEEFEKAILLKRIDIAVLKRYAIEMSNRNLINVLGFLLERNGMVVDDLIGYRSRNYVKAFPNARKRNSRWRVLY
jgi:predicted transcriptional regulator of viral defense system